MLAYTRYTVAVGQTHCVECSSAEHLFRRRRHISTVACEIPRDSSPIQLREHLGNLVYLCGTDSWSGAVRSGGSRGVAGRLAQIPPYRQERDDEEDDKLRNIERLLRHRGRRVRGMRMWRRV